MSSLNAMTRLETALRDTADALTAVIREQPHQWDKLCEKETGELIALLQYYEAFPPSGSLLPQTVVGQRVLELLVERHPALCQDLAGTA
jgi:hypothetical protein